MMRCVGCARLSARLATWPAIHLAVSRRNFASDAGLAVQRDVYAASKGIAHPVPIRPTGGKRRVRRGKLADEPQFKVDFERVGQPLSVDEVVTTLSSEQGEDIVTIDTEGRLDYCDHVILCSSSLSSKHLQRMARVLVKKLRIRDLPGHHVDGLNSTDWILVDTGRIVVHLLTPERRAELDMEGWIAGTEPEEGELEMMWGKEGEAIYSSASAGVKQALMQHMKANGLVDRRGRRRRASKTKPKSDSLDSE